MNRQTATPTVTTITIAPMKGPTYHEALGYILQTPRRLWTILEFFAPEEADRAAGALLELYTLGAVVHKDGLYMLPSKRDAS